MAVSVIVPWCQSFIVNYVYLVAVFFQHVADDDTQREGQIILIRFPQPPDFVIRTTKTVGEIFWKNQPNSVIDGVALPGVALDVLPELLHSQQVFRLQYILSVFLIGVENDNVLRPSVIRGD